MDIRAFFNKRKKDQQQDTNTNATAAKQHKLASESQPSTTAATSRPTGNRTPQQQDDRPSCSRDSSTNTGVLDHSEVEFLTLERKDIGLYLNENKRSKLTRKDKLEILKNPFKPQENHNFKGDVAENQRPFLYPWLEKYSPWLAYSVYARGALCLFCVLFPQAVRRGIQGAFIVRTFTKHRQFHDEAKAHMRSHWHQAATEDAINFMGLCENPEENVVGQINANYRATIEHNRLILNSLLKGILFCAMHDIALRGKTAKSGNLYDLYEFRAEAVDKVLQKHLETAPKNARYTSVQTVNELIELSADVIRKKIVLKANGSIGGFALMADETADISGVEQFSIGIRYVDYCEMNLSIHEEFLGFSALKAMDAETISQEILNVTEKYGLEMQKLVGQGYDGCSTMAGEVSGVQQRIRDLYPKAYFMHCTSHWLNLVINDQNNVMEIRNAVAVIKSVIVYFRESSVRRHLVSRIPLLCETRWSEKYKSIRLFYQNFCDIFTKLVEITQERKYSSDSRQKALQHIRSLSSSDFLVCLAIIAKYSAMLEPTARALQAVNIDIHSMQQQINTLIKIITTHRNMAEEIFLKDVYAEVKEISNKLHLELIIPRITSMQCYRANFAATNVQEYFRKAIYIPYLDSILASLKTRFDDSKFVPNRLLILHPTRAVTLSREEFKAEAEQIDNIYKIENFCMEALTWYDMWKHSNELENVKNRSLDEIIIRYCKFYPAVRHALLIALTLPSTCTVERSFSTLRRVKTWLRTTCGEDRTSGLCMISVHRNKVKENMQEITNKVINDFSSQPRRLQLLFTHDV